MTEYIMLPFAIGFVLLVRLLPAWLWPTFTSDAGFHLLMRREIRSNGFRVPRKLTSCVFDERVTYPWLYHQLIAFLPESWLRRIPALPSAIIDGLHAALAYWGASWLAIQLGHPGVAMKAGFLSAIFFGINPALLAHGMGPRAYEVTPRPLGELFFSATLMAAIWALSGGGWVWWLVSALSGGGLLLSSKFAAQVLVFFVPLLALVPGLHAVLWLLPGSFAMAMLLSRGRYWHVLRGQFVHLDWYRRRHQYTDGMIASRNRFREIQECWAVARSYGIFSREALRAAGKVYTTNTYFLLLSRGGIFLIGLALCMTTMGRLVLAPGTPPGLWLFAWGMAWIVPFALTSSRHYRFLGEAERYAEYGIWPVAVLVGTGLAVASLSTGMAVVLLLYAFIAIGVIGHAWAVNAKVAFHSGSQQEELVAVLTCLPTGSCLLGIPAMQVLAPVASLLPHRYADIAAADGRNFIKMIEKCFEGYPWPRPDWAMWRELGVDYIVTYSPAQMRQLRPGLPYDRIPLKVVFQTPSFLVYAYSCER